MENRVHVNPKLNIAYFNCAMHVDLVSQATPKYHRQTHVALCCINGATTPIGLGSPTYLYIVENILIYFNIILLTI